MKLKEVCEVFSGYAFKDFHNEKVGFPVIKIGNIKPDGTIDLINCSFTSENPNDRFVSKPGDIYIALSGATTGKIGLMTKGGYYVNQRVGIVRLKVSNIPVHYMKYFLDSKTTKILTDAAGAAQPNISPKDIEKYIFFEKSADEMIKIANELDLINNEISKKQKRLLDYDEVIKSRFNELFGDPLLNEKRFPTEKLSSACPFNVYKGDVDTIDGKVWLLNLDMIESNTGVILNKLYVDIAEVGNSVIKFDNDCVLYSKLRPYLNKVVVSYGSGYASSELVYMKTGKRIKKEFLANLLRTKSFVDYIDSKSGGAKMPRASMDFLRNFSLIIPPENLQEQFVAFVNQIDKSKFVKIPQ